MWQYTFLRAVTLFTLEEEPTGLMSEATYLKYTSCKCVNDYIGYRSLWK